MTTTRKRRCLLRVWACAGIVCMALGFGAPSSRGAETADAMAKISPRVRAWAAASEKSAARETARMRVMIEIAPAPEDRPAHAPVSARAIAAGQAQVEDLLSGPDFKPLARMESLSWIVAEIGPAALQRLSVLPEVRRVCASLRVQGDLAQSARVIGADRVHRFYQYKGKGVDVALIDSGVDLDHPDLIGRVSGGRFFLEDATTSGSNVQDDHGHGTHVAGIIVGIGAEAPQGVAPEAGLVVIRALKKEADGSLGGFMSDIIRGMDWLIANRANYPTMRTINMSIAASLPGGQCPCDTADEDFAPLVAAVDRATQAGLICVASAGNGGPNTMTAPGCFSKVVAVGATYDHTFSRAPTTGTYDLLAGGFPACYDSAVTTDTMTCFGSRLACLKLVAPGYLITGPLLDGTRINSFGTSAATAHVTGALALLQGLGPGWDPNALVTVLQQTGRDVVDPTNPARHFRRINVYEAMKLVRGTSARTWTAYE